MSVAEAKMLEVPTISEGQDHQEAIGARLKRLRLERGLSQRDLSSPGVSYAYISRIEAGARTPSVKALRMLAKKLNVSVEYLETGRDLRESEDRELRLGDAELAIRFEADTRPAEEDLERLRDEALTAGDQVGAARAVLALGFAAARRGNHLDAVERLEEGLRIHRVAPHLRPDVYATLGQSYAALGAPERSVRLFETCLTELDESASQDANLRVRFATLLSYALSDAGEHERATSVVREIAATMRQDGDPHNRVRLYWAVARSSGISGQTVEALEYIRRAITLLEVTDDTLQLARGHMLAGSIEVEEGHPDQAREHLELAEPLLGPNSLAADRGMLSVVQAQLAAAEGDGALAVDRARRGLTLLGDLHGGEQGTAVLALARGLVLEGDDEGANDSFRRAVDLLAVHGRRYEAAKAAVAWAEFLRSRGRNDEAEPVLQRAAELGLGADIEAARQR
jgi:transcriptional regulator with XRE-family HTH domain